MVIAPDLQVGAFLSEAVATLGKEGRLNQGRDRCIAGSAMGMEVRGGGGGAHLGGELWVRKKLVHEPNQDWVVA